jgi:hypothetical protein
MTEPRPRWGAVTVDCLDPERLAEFWAAMLDTSVRGRWGEQYVHLHSLPGAPALAFQRVAAKTPGKNALHLDVHVADESEVEPVVQRALTLGAREHARMQQDGVEWVVLLDPEDNEFCVLAFGEQDG